MAAVLALLGIGAAAWPELASAHAFGQTYTLPVPAWLFMYGGGAAVVVSFVLIGLFVGHSTREETYATRDISDWLIVRWLQAPWLKVVARGLGLALFLLTLAAGWFGTQSAITNWTPTFFWVVFYLGIIYLTALVGPIWRLVSPFEIIVPRQGLLNYPKWLGVYPAFLFYFWLIWEELLSSGAAIHPAHLAWLIAIYSLITIAGGFLFGRRAWLDHGEFLNVFLTLIAQIAPFEYTQGRVMLRWPFAGLRTLKLPHFSWLVLIIFMLASTAFDGFRGTKDWVWLITHLPRIEIMPTLLLIVALVLFLDLYLFFIALMKAMTGDKTGTLALAVVFGPSLIPIAFVYNVAHYYMLLLTQGQALISIASDPFGRGGDLFHTIHYVINPAPVPAAWVWYIQVGLIVGGHIVSVYLAHRIALARYPSARTAILSQYPMLILMVAYTMTGLWILSQPLTLGG